MIRPMFIKSVLCTWKYQPPPPHLANYSRYLPLEHKMNIFLCYSDTNFCNWYIAYCCIKSIKVQFYCPFWKWFLMGPLDFWVFLRCKNGINQRYRRILEDMRGWRVNFYFRNKILMWICLTWRFTEVYLMTLLQYLQYIKFDNNACLLLRHMFR